MLMQGTKGETQKQLVKGLGLSGKTREEAFTLMEKITKTVQHTKHVEISIASKLYVTKTAKVKTAFSSLLKKKFGAPEQIDFSKSDTKTKINKWCEENTKGKIKNFFSRIDAAADAILINAIYLKVPWLRPFNPENSKIMPFNVNAKEKVDTMFMSVLNEFNYGENTDLNCKFVELLCKDDQVSMFLLVPNKVDGLAALEKKLIEGKYDFWKIAEGCSGGYAKKAIHLQMPKFNVTLDSDLKKILPKVGLQILLHHFLNRRH